MAALQVYVRDLGRGLVMVGGPRSYGAGGYTDTPLEETLPVDMGVRDREKQPDVALVVVIDKSGSMDACHCNSFNGGAGGGSGIGGVRKVDIGKEAILRAASALSAQDELGVVAFDDSAHWVIQTAPLGGLQDIQSAIAGINPNGQTNIFAGLDQAVKSLEGATATRRHIILLTDGWSTSGQYDAILKQMKADGITLSTVGAGGGANPFLEQLAKQGGGRFYAATNPASIPDIFLKETQQVSGQQIVEEPFFPILTSSSPVLRGIDNGFPKLLGYNGTTAKPAAQTVLVTARDDPLLAQWQYGLGRSIAWTSDSTGHWARNWVPWQGFSKFFSQLVGWTFPGEESGGIEASFVDRGGRTYLRVESQNSDGSGRDFYATSVAMVGPDLQPATVNLNQVASGVYEAPVEHLESGAYAVRVTQTQAGKAPLGRTLGLVAPTAAEYRLLGANEPLLAAIRAATGGRELDTPAAPWVHDLETTSQFTELWPWLLVLALLLWPLDIALRRVSLGRRELADGRRWVTDRVRGRRVAPRTQPVEGLFAARNRAGASGARSAILREATDGSATTASAQAGAVARRPGDGDPDGCAHAHCRDCRRAGPAAGSDAALHRSRPGRRRQRLRRRRPRHLRPRLRPPRPRRRHRPPRRPTTPWPASGRRRPAAGARSPRALASTSPARGVPHRPTRSTPWASPPHVGVTAASAFWHDRRAQRRGPIHRWRSHVHRRAHSLTTRRARRRPGRRGGRRCAVAGESAVGRGGQRGPGPHRGREHRRRDDQLREHGRGRDLAGGRPLRQRHGPPGDQRHRPRDHGDLDRRDARATRTRAPTRRTGTASTRRSATRASASTVTDEAGVYGFADVSLGSVGRGRRVVPGRRPDRPRRHRRLRPSARPSGLLSIRRLGRLRTGDVGIVGDVNATGVGVYGFAGTSAIPNPPTGIGVYARAGSNSQLALRVQGRAKFSRSGRVSVSGATKTVTLSGVSAANYLHRGDMPGGRRGRLRALGRPGERFVQDPPLEEAVQGGDRRVDRLREAVGVAMSYPRRFEREKWTGRRIAGAADDMAWERHVEGVQQRLARYEIHRPAVTATANEWDRHVREVKARITEAKHRR